MTKGETIVLRISSEDKAAIKAAAANAGKSLTTFITEAAVKRAGAAAQRPPVRGVHGGLPTHFKAMCFEAAQGGTGGYEICGFHLAAIVGDEQPYDIEWKEWQVVVRALWKLVAKKNDSEAVWDWFQEHYPKFMALIPARRREQFLAGVRRAFDEGLIDK